MSIVVHIGLPRAASTTLQRTVFPRVKGVTYLGVGRSSQPSLKIRPKLFEDLWKADEKNFDSIAEEWAHIVDQARTVSEKEDTDIVISYEGWCRPFANNNLAVVARRIKIVFRDPIIFLTLRQPLQWLESCYNKCAWNNLLFRAPDDPLDLSSIRNYYDIIKIEQDRFFGKTGLVPNDIVPSFDGMDLRIVPIEWMLQTKFKGLSEIFPGWVIPDNVNEWQNKSQSPLTLYLVRHWYAFPPILRSVSREFIRRILPRFPERFFRKSRWLRVPEDIANEILANYSLCFDGLNKSCHVDLAEYGYLNPGKRSSL